MKVTRGEKPKRTGPGRASATATTEPSAPGPAQARNCCESLSAAPSVTGALRTGRPGATRRTCTAVVTMPAMTSVPTITSREPSGSRPAKYSRVAPGRLSRTRAIAAATNSSSSARSPRGSQSTPLRTVSGLGPPVGVTASGSGPVSSRGAPCSGASTDRSKGPTSAAERTSVSAATAPTTRPATFSAGRRRARSGDPATISSGPPAGRSATWPTSGV